MGKTLIIGFGNLLMGDDGAGIHLIQKLATVDLPAEVELIDGGVSSFAALAELPEDLRRELADALRRLRRAHVALEGASDHGVSEALYLRDPDGNGVELYWDKPRDQWPRTPSGQIQMVTDHLDLQDLLAELD